MGLSIPLVTVLIFAVVISAELFALAHLVRKQEADYQRWFVSESISGFVYGVKSFFRFLCLLALLGFWLWVFLSVSQGV